MKKVMSAWIVILFIVSIASADIEIEPIAESAKHPRIDAGQVVWQGFDGRDGKIYFWDGTTVQILTDDIGYPSRDPQINNGQAVWAGHDGFHSNQVYFWDGKKVLQLSDKSNRCSDDQGPQIDDGQIVWAGRSGDDGEIYFVDNKTETYLQLTANDFRDHNPQIKDGLVVWSGSVGNMNHKEEIFYWDFYGDRKVHQLTDNGIDDEHPRINNRQIVWQGKRRGGNWEIYFWNGGKIRKLTDNNYRDGNPQIDDGLVVWSGSAGGMNHKEEIFYWDFYGDKRVHQLTDNDIDDEKPQTHNGQMVWQGKKRGGNWEIYFWDGEKREIRQLTDNNYNDENPRINNQQVVWTGNPNGLDGNSEVFRGSIRPEQVVPAPEPDSDNARSITNGQIDYGHPAVGIMVTPGVSGCTGTLIGRRTVLTAAHCTKKTDARVRFHLGDDIYNGTAFVIDQWRYKYRDLCLVRLDEPVGTYPKKYVEPMPICDLTGSDLRGVDVTIVGFGRTSSGSPTDWTKRKGTSSIYATHRPGMMNISGTSHTCYGDSGGPALLSVPNRGECIVGVSSWLLAPECKSYEVHTRPDIYKNWINGGFGGADVRRVDSRTWHRSKRTCTIHVGGIRLCRWQHESQGPPQGPR
jgi:hypothetical protein